MVKKLKIMVGQPPKKNKDTTKVVIICVTIAVVVVIAMITLMSVIYMAAKAEIDGAISKNEILTNNEENMTSPTTITGQDTNNTEPTNTFIGGTTTVDKPTSTYTVKYGGFTLYVPDDLIYNQGSTTNGNDVLSIMNAKGTWMASMQIVKGSYQTIKQNKTSIRENLMQQLAAHNTTVSEAKVENIGGVEYLIFEVQTDDETGLIVYTELNSMNCGVLTIESLEKDFDRDALEKLTPIITTAQYTGEAANIKEEQKDILEALKKINKEITKE